MPRMHTHGSTIGFYSSMRVFHFDVLMAHQCPGRNVCPIKLSGSPKIFDSFLVFSPQRVMISYQISPPELSKPVQLIETYQWDSKLLVGLFPTPKIREQPWTILVDCRGRKGYWNKCRCHQYALGQWKESCRIQLQRVCNLCLNQKTGDNEAPFTNRECGIMHRPLNSWSKGC